MRTGKRKFPLTQPRPEERGRDPNDRPTRLATARQADDESVTKTSRKKLCGFRWFFAGFCRLRLARSVTEVGKDDFEFFVRLT